MSYEVPHPELAVVGVSSLFLGMPAAGFAEPTYDRFAIISLVQINNLEPLPVPSAPSTNGPAQST